jgi:uroporphyrinogen-III synthase
MDKRRTVFISRDLQKSSPLQSVLAKAGFEVYGQSLISFSLLPFAALPLCDWIFFYSRNGVRFFFEGLKRLDVALPPGVQLAVMGKGTASTLEEHGQAPGFVGAGRPDATARAFLKVAKGENILFARALHSAKSIQNMLSPYINIIDFPVYKNEIKTEVDIPQTDYVILTSSMNVDAYFKNASDYAPKAWIAIGRPTALRYAQWTSMEVFLPEHPSEEALARLILDLDKKDEKK